MSRIRVGAAGALLVAAVVVPAVPAHGVHAQAAPEIDWTGPCDYADTLECGTLQVPLDHARPAGDRITLAVERHLATGSGAKLGSILVNAGGPGAAGLTFSADVARRLGPRVAERYDIVSFAPRGVGPSNPIQCFADDAAYESAWGGVQDVPLSKEEQDRSLDAAVEEATTCRDNQLELLQQMSTLDVARDLDLLRQAVGDEKLNYAGYSYGTMLGAVYANVFSQRVGRFILDGPVDPAARVSQRVENKRARAEGFEIALDGFLAACAELGAPTCAFAAGDLTPAQKFARLRDELRKGPVQAGSGEWITISTMTNAVGGVLYSRADLAEAAAGLEEMYGIVFGAQARAESTRTLRLPSITDVDPRLDQVPGTRTTPGDAYGYNGSDSFFAVNCADTRMPRNRAEYPRIATSYELTAPTFGTGEAFSEATCGFWPDVRDRYTGPWNTTTATPILIVGQTHDPATPYSMAQRMERQLGNARLLTVDGFGHCSQDSRCAQAAQAEYLLTGALPAPGARCDQDLGPLDGPAT
ncbi:MAG: alpha/beta fold hydrolase [Streptosporangiales bacterium]|nr:alpha/beta fold hydrolase [Streptosporangiales bacterium]